MIRKIKQKLEEISRNVQVGICKKKDESWNCLLIRKEKLVKSGTSRLDYSAYVSIRIIKEDEIPEGTEQQIIEKMREIGWKMTDSPAQYEYRIDSNEIVVEICKMEFAKTQKRVC